MKRIFLVAIVINVFVWAGAARYTRSDTGVVTDSGTGLQWQDNYSDNGGNVKLAKWIDAIAYCESLSLNGESWRLPNRKELLSIVNYNRSNPSIDTSVFAHTVTLDYLSSTAYPGITDYARTVNFKYGDSSLSAKSSTNFVRCVRGGQ